MADHTGHTPGKPTKPAPTTKPAPEKPAQPDPHAGHDMSKAGHDMGKMEKPKVPPKGADKK